MLPPFKEPAIARSRDVQVTIWTAGLKHVGEGGLSLEDCGPDRRRELLRLAQSANSFSSAPVRSTLFKELLECSYTGVGHDDVVHQMDTRQFHDPERCGRGGRKGINHIGLSGPVLLRVAKDKAFGQWFFDQVRAVLAAAQAHRGPGRLHVVSFCRAGRHRSVAVATLLGRLLRQFTEWDVVTEHLARKFWMHGTCNNCEECNCPSGTNKDAGTHAEYLAEIPLQWAFWQAARASSRR